MSHRHPAMVTMYAADKPSPANGDIWYNLGTGKLRKREGGVTTDLDTTGAPGSVDIKQTEVDFGATPVADGTFVVADAGVTGASQLMAQLAYEAPTGKDLDEIEMDSLEIKCGPGSGQFTMFISSTDGSYLHDMFKINYLVG